METTNTPSTQEVNQVVNTIYNMNRSESMRYVGLDPEASTYELLEAFREFTSQEDWFSTDIVAKRNRVELLKFYAYVKHIAMMIPGSYTISNWKADLEYPLPLETLQKSWAFGLLFTYKTLPGEETGDKGLGPIADSICYSTRVEDTEDCCWAVEASMEGMGLESSVIRDTLALIRDVRREAITKDFADKGLKSILQL